MFKKISKKMLTWMTLAILVLPLVLASATAFTTKASAAETDPTLERIQKKGTLVVGLSADYAPYEFHSQIDGKDQIVGFDVSLAKAIAKKLGVKIQIEDMGFDALLGALKTGKIDMIASGFSATPERESQVDFSHVYLKSPQTMIVLKTNKAKYESGELSAFSGQKIGAQTQTIQEDAAKTIPGATVVSLQKYPNLISQLSQGVVAGVVAEKTIAQAYADQNPKFAVVEPKFSADSTGQTSIAVPKNSPALVAQVNQVIDKVTTNGQFNNWKKQAQKQMFASKDKSYWQKYGHYFVEGTGITLALAVVGVLIGTTLGTFFALLKLSSVFILKAIGNIYVEYVRGTPLLVQAFMVFFGTQAIGLHLSAFVAGSLAMGLNSAAYVAEIIRSGIESVDKGQTEAARSLGLSHAKTMRLVILPQAVRTILPALGNEFVSVIKEGSVISVIGVGELMYETGVVQGASFEPFMPLVIASLIYFVLTFTISRALGYAERRMAR
ncbi:ABC transporter substrate-binding protein/permease [Fructobacillus tropaeoli]|uniref:Periplasmic component/domain (HisJ) n=1 Tax=Fructobacillus tropaeoli TaxID=709323 RepID=A0ABN9YSE5_9LACO|nr:ABC transporter substrate-binding protein/permease [Fructobacillus tropaeoli]GIC69652.1 ABC transporter substrate-binding protein/permease [Fructobacillus tropaeoli]CAK1234786.1 ABC-type amino acid transport/signal transduction system [Fructobacillus tropaeoli]CAK1235250.1 ABC-type amino acid transport/signal transduction system [Fructobacillus tropaeoli]CAK1238816.1 ABC-type amino acid transport/signal transduction system [Fructobacillus tropaeoli]